MVAAWVVLTMFVTCVSSATSGTRSERGPCVLLNQFGNVVSMILGLVCNCAGTDSLQARAKALELLAPWLTCDGGRKSFRGCPPPVAYRVTLCGASWLRHVTC